MGFWGEGWGANVELLIEKTKIAHHISQIA
jgi:hypothetical protein